MNTFNIYDDNFVCYKDGHTNNEKYTSDIFDAVRKYKVRKNDSIIFSRFPIIFTLMTIYVFFW